MPSALCLYGWTVVYNNQFIMWASQLMKPRCAIYHWKKAILAMVHATRKLPHYFQAHIVVMLTQLPLKSVLRSADYTRRIAKWGTILGVFDIKYMPRTSIKGQVLADLKRWKGKIRN